MNDWKLNTNLATKIDKETFDWSSNGITIDFSTRPGGIYLLLSTYEAFIIDRASNNLLCYRIKESEVNNRISTIVVNGFKLQLTYPVTVSLRYKLIW